MKKNLFICIVVLTILGVALLAKFNPPSTNTLAKAKVSGESHLEPNLESGKTDAKLVAKETLYDFGTISMKNGNVSKIFELTNTSSSELTIEEIVTSCMCTNAFVITGENKQGPYGMPGHGRSVPKANAPVGPGETIKVEVVYDPNAHGPAGVGLIDRYVYLTYADNQQVELEIKAIVTP